MSKLRGFTLVELLITVAIISILSAVGLIAYSSVLKQGRDSKRQSDLRSIQSALEQYFSDQLYYPAVLPSSGTFSFGSKKYINTMPVDPVGDPQYSYVASGTNCAGATPQNCISYCLFAKLENLSGSDLKGCASTGAYNFALTPP